MGTIDNDTLYRFMKEVMDRITILENKLDTILKSVGGVEETLERNTKVAEDMGQYTWILQKIGNMMSSPSRLINVAWGGQLKND